MSTLNKRIGIFAGTFDPIHEGHLAFAESTLRMGLEKVMFLVEPRPRRKQGVHAVEHRVAMVQLAIADKPHFGTIVLEQARLTPHETLPILQNRFKGYELALLFGDDVISHMVDHIAAWPHIEDLANSASLVIATRHDSQSKLTESLRYLKEKHNLPFRYDFVEPDQTNVSSSQIRLAIKHRKPIVGLPEPVKNYITQNNLYAAGEIIS